MYELFSKDKETWYKYKKSKEKNEYYDHVKHTHYPQFVMEEIKSTFRDLSNLKFL